MKKLTALTLSLTLAIVLAACGGSSSGTYTGDISDDTPAQTAATPAPAPDPTPTPEPDPTPAPISYEEGNIVEFGGYEWRVLEVSGGKALLLSEYVIAFKAYYSDFYAPGTCWADCDLRTYLNGEFLDSFSEGDRAKIAQTKVINTDNPWSGIPGGDDTDDYIFLLSIEEVVKYFGDSGQLANPPADADGYINDEYNEARIAYSAIDDPRGLPAGSAEWWWLRSPGGWYEVANVTGNGWILVAADGWEIESTGVRPAMWVNLD